MSTLRMILPREVIDVPTATHKVGVGHEDALIEPENAIAVTFHFAPPSLVDIMEGPDPYCPPATQSTVLGQLMVVG